MIGKSRCGYADSGESVKGYWAECWGFRRLLVTAGLAVMICSQVMDAQAQQTVQRYQITEGSGYPVCHDFLDNLNAFPSDEPPMVCRQKIHPSHPEFTRPDWVEMDIEENLELIYEAEALLWVLTPIGTEAKPFSEWETAYRERLVSGESRPRLRKLPVTSYGRKETLIWYEPLADACERELEESGVAGGPGGHIFVLRKDGRLQAFGGLVGTQSRTDVLYYHGEYLYFTTSDPEYQGRRPLWVIGLHAMSPKLTGGDQFLVRARCEYHANRVLGEEEKAFLEGLRDSTR